MHDLTFSGTFLISEIYVQDKTVPYCNFKVGDTVTFSIPAFGHYLSSGRGYSVNVKVTHDGNTYTVVGGRLVTKARSNWKLIQLNT